MLARAVGDDGAEAGYVLAPSAIKPEPVSIDVKVVLIGDLGLYHLLYASDEEFRLGWSAGVSATPGSWVWWVAWLAAGLALLRRLERRARAS